MSRFHVKFWAIAVSFVYMAVFQPESQAQVSWELKVIVHWTAKMVTDTEL